MLIEREPVWISWPCLLDSGTPEPELAPFLERRSHHAGFSHHSCRNVAVGRVVDREYGHELDLTIEADMLTAQVSQRQQKAPAAITSARWPGASK